MAEDTPQRPFTGRFDEGPAPTPATPSTITADISGLTPDRVRIPTPAPYDGINKNPAAVRQWIVMTEIYFDAINLREGPIFDDTRILRAATFLKDDAAFWYYKEYRPTRPRGNAASWQHFVAAIIKKFEPVPVSKSARIQLRQLEQGDSSVADYNATFVHLTSQIANMDEEDEVEYYINGLRPEIGDLVRSFLRDSLADNMSLAIRTEDSLHTALARRAIPTKHVELGTMTSGKQRDSGKPIKLGESERKKLLAEGRCFRCHEQGHMMRDCPTFK